MLDGRPASSPDTGRPQLLGVLANPRAAALVAALPAGPGQTLTRAELFTASGLGVDAAGLVLSRLCDLGLVSTATPSPSTEPPSPTWSTTSPWCVGNSSSAGT